MQCRGYDISKAVELIFKYWLERLSDSELEEYKRMKETTGLQKYTAEFENRTWIKEELEKVSVFNIDEAWQHFGRLTKKKPRIRIRRWKIAASLLIPLMIGGGVGLYLWQQPASVTADQEIGMVKSRAIVTLANGDKISLEAGVSAIAEKDGTTIQHQDGQLIYSTPSQTSSGEVLYNELTVPRGGEYLLTLADGSRVWLNAESRLKYPVHFNGSQRQVFLSGEAYFAVERDTVWPFVVSTSSGNIQVLGTEFNVRDYRDEDQVVTTLVKGSVRYSNSKLTSFNLILKPGEQVRAGRNGERLELLQVDPQEFVSWKEGVHFFHKQSLEEMMKTIERSYDVEVVFCDESLKKLRFSGRLKKYERVEEFLRFIETGGDVTFTVKDRTIIVNPK